MLVSRTRGFGVAVLKPVMPNHPARIQRDLTFRLLVPLGRIRSAPAARLALEGREYSGYVSRSRGRNPAPGSLAGPVAFGMAFGSIAATARTRPQSA